MLSALRRLISGPRAEGAEVPPAPECEVAVVGDIHGRADLLDRLLGRLEQVAPGAQLVFVGDYVDRGPDSRAVIETLRAMSGAVCLKGNHEAMLLDFLDGHEGAARRWLFNGGTRTLESYGVALAEDAGAAEVARARAAFAAALGRAAERWLRELPLMWRSGNLVVTHAGPDPARPIPAPGEREDELLWGHARFMRAGRSDGVWVAHGHWIRLRPEVGESRISVDTGAFDTGRLSAAVISPAGRVRFVRA